MVDDKDDDSDDQSISSLIDSLLTITRHLRTLLKKNARGYNVIVLPFAQKIADELEKLKGLHLDGYRGRMENLIDLGNCIRGNIRMGLADHTGLGELRRYAREKIDENENEKQENEQKREKQEKEKQERERWQREQHANWIIEERTRQKQREQEWVRSLEEEQEQRQELGRLLQEEQKRKRELESLLAQRQFWIVVLVCGFIGIIAIRKF